MATIEEKYLDSRLQKVEQTNSIIINTLQNDPIVSIVPDNAYTYQNLCFLYGQDEYNVHGLESTQIVNLINNARYDYYDPDIEGMLHPPLYFAVGQNEKYYLYYTGTPIELKYTHGEPCLIQSRDFTACYELYVDKGGALIFNFHYNLPLNLDRILRLPYGESTDMPDVDSLMWFVAGNVPHPITCIIYTPDDPTQGPITEQGFITCDECDNQHMELRYMGPNGTISLTYESVESSAESIDYFLLSNVNWDNYINPYLSTDDSNNNAGGYAIHYRLCPTPENMPDNFPHPSWPTTKIINEPWDFRSELEDKYYTAIGAGGACALDNSNRITAIWGDITIYVKSDPKY